MWVFVTRPGHPHGENTAVNVSCHSAWPSPRGEHCSQCEYLSLGLAIPTGRTLQSMWVFVTQPGHPHRENTAVNVSICHSAWPSPRGEHCSQCEYLSLSLAIPTGRTLQSMWVVVDMFCYRCYPFLFLFFFVLSVVIGELKMIKKWSDRLNFSSVKGCVKSLHLLAKLCTKTQLELSKSLSERLRQSPWKCWILTHRCFY